MIFFYNRLNKYYIPFVAPSPQTSTEQGLIVVDNNQTNLTTIVDTDDNLKSYIFGLNNDKTPIITRRKCVVDCLTSDVTRLQKNYENIFHRAPISSNSEKIYIKSFVVMPEM